jgi:hypothetical protein
MLASVIKETKALKTSLNSRACCYVQEESTTVNMQVQATSHELLFETFINAALTLEELFGHQHQE